MPPAPLRNPFAHYESNSLDFDFPSAEEPDSTIGDLTVRFDHLRRQLQTEREEFNVAREAAASSRTRVRMRSPPMPPRTLRRTASFRNIMNPRTESGTEASESDRDRNLPAFRLPRIRMRRRVGALRRLRDDQQQHVERADEQLRERLDRLEQLSSELQDHSRTLQQTDPDYARRRGFKRVKLSHPSHDEDNGVKAPSGFHDFKYGPYGQVMPGHLRMEIMSTDGGQYDHHSDSGYGRSPYPPLVFCPENVLKDDKSVYCTSRGLCNIMLRHVDESSFTLSTLVIKAPEHGYTAAVQQGMVFLGYDREELLSRTAAYRIHYDTPETSARSHDPTHDPSIGLRSRRQRPTHAQDIDYISTLHDNRLWQNYSHRRLPHPAAPPYDSEYAANRDTSTRIPHSPTTVARSHTNPVIDDFSDYCEWPPLAPIRYDDLTRAPTPPAFTITADYADNPPSPTVNENNNPLIDLLDPRDPSDPTRQQSTRHRQPPPLSTSEPASEWNRTIHQDLAFPTPDLHYRFADGTHQRYAAWAAVPPVRGNVHAHAHARRERPGVIRPIVEVEGLRNAREGAGGRRGDGFREDEETEEDALERHASRGDEPLRPDARFFIGKAENTVTVRFDPPISGRFLLVKLFSPVHEVSGNIDIQYVGAYGYAGTRLFPALGYRALEMPERMFDE